MTDRSTERRRAQRVEANLKLDVALPGSGEERATLETINISTSGVYFRSAHFIEPMTKLGMDMEVSVPADGDDGVDKAVVACEGLVVRVSPEAETEGCDEYEVAVFFTNIDPGGMENLERHIALLMDDTD